MTINRLEILKATLNRANMQYDRGEITKEELKKVLFEVYYQYRKIMEEEEEAITDDFSSFLSFFNRKDRLN